jgi:phage-related protein
MKIVFFDESIEKFLYTLEKPVVAKTIRSLELLEEFGSRLGPHYSKKVADGLYELRVSGNQQIRLFYTQQRKTIVILHCFKKKSQKVPPGEIRKAKQRIRRLGEL